jgi:DNA-directed RNA polymerase specialized sigma24 family protein
LTDDPDDAQLLERWRRGDAIAGNELFRRHYRSVARMFRNKAGDALEDLVQRTFLACLERTDRIEDPARFRRYLLATARNELYRFFRDRRGPRRVGSNVPALWADCPDARIDPCGRSRIGGHAPRERWGLTMM